jgi:hypothetical protein
LPILPAIPSHSHERARECRDSADIDVAREHHGKVTRMSGTATSRYQRQSSLTSLRRFDKTPFHHS